MKIEIDTSGADGIATVAAAVRRLGADRTIVNNMVKRIRTGIVPPARAAFRAAAVEVLPSGGGLGAWVARASVLARVRRGANSAGVTLTAGRNTSGHRVDMKAIDAGRLRHKTFGHRPWVLQSVNPGVFSESVSLAGVDAFRTVIIDSVNEAVQEVLR